MQWLKPLLLSAILVISGGSFAQTTLGTDAERISALAESGNADAQAILGVWYLEGNEVDKSTSQAQKWLEQAAENGQLNAQLLLGVLYIQGDNGFQKDVQKAIKYFSQATDKDNSDAQLALGMIYITEFNSDEYLQEGLQLIEKSAQQGNEDAISFLKDLKENK